MTFNPTAEQQDIRAAFASGDDLKVMAGAGAGKTSTLKYLADDRPGQRGLYVAYNRPICDEARKSFPRSVECKTTHSMGRSAARPFLEAGRTLDEPRQPSRIVARILGIRQDLRLAKDLAPITPARQASLVTQTVSKFCHSGDEQITIKHLPHVAGLTDTPAMRQALATALLPFARRAWQDMSSPRGQLKFAHDTYLKLFQLSHPVLPFDYLLVDEAQDLNPAVKAIVDDQVGRLQVVLVGDSCQAINGWNGAVDALETFTGKELYLTQSFRFGPAIAAEANKWLSILDANMRITGSGPANSWVGGVPAPRAVLCRTNAGAMSEVMAAAGEGRKVALAGGGKDMAALIRAAIDLQAGRGTDHNELLAFTTWDEVCDYAASPEGGDLKPVVQLVDEHGTDHLLAVVTSLVDPKTADVTVSTAHKSKGLQWSTVKVANDFREPRPTAGNPNPELSRELSMLAYVTVTRAQNGLDRDGLSWVDRWLPDAPLQQLAALIAPTPELVTVAAPVAPAPAPAAVVQEPAAPATLLPAGWEDLPDGWAVLTDELADEWAAALDAETTTAALAPVAELPAHCLRCGCTRCYCDPTIAATWSERVGIPAGPAGKYTSNRVRAAYLAGVR